MVDEVRPVIRAAGAVLRDGDLVAVVHRPRYDDWSLPKGKLDRGEAAPAAAVREVFEETGFRAVLGPYLRAVRYAVDGVPKVVDYYAADVVAGSFAPNEEVDELRWLSPAEAAGLVSRDEDRAVLAAFTALPGGLRTLLLVRHAKAGKREHWSGDDDLRPLSAAGWRQAEALRGVLPLWGASRVHAAPRLRCEQTVRAVADDLGVPVRSEPALSEEGYWPDRDAALARVARLLEEDDGVPVVSSQGGVIPDLVEALAALGGVALEGGRTPSKKGSAWVLSFRPGAPGWSTSDPASRWPRLAAAHYLPTALGKPLS
ncbi:NUDIX hydrolase [Actinosynnema pretiosum]|uniref:NUDIX hydrolase n=1 Tax=Actinosynnema pretiosum TaxID=42197 RepID=A0A290ZD42_9PSEU|nr:NUDIX hydrolase [Actinosynnema pretiosum]